MHEMINRITLLVILILVSAPAIAAQRKAKATAIELRCEVNAVDLYGDSEKPNITMPAVHIKIADGFVSIYDLPSFSETHVDRYKIAASDGGKVRFKSNNSENITGSIDRVSGELSIIQDGLPLYLGKCKGFKRLF
jgi:hypothetical protein